MGLGVYDTGKEFSQVVIHKEGTCTLFVDLSLLKHSQD